VQRAQAGGRARKKWGLVSERFIGLPGVVPKFSKRFFEHLKNAPCERYIPRVPASKKPDDRQFKVDDKIRVNLHQGKIEDAVVRAVIQDDDGTKLQVDVVGLDLTALIDTRQFIERSCPVLLRKI